MKINFTSYYRTAIAGALVFLSSAMFAQQNPVISSQNGDRKDKRVNLDLLQSTLDTLLSRSQTIGEAVSNGGDLPTVDWSATLGNSTSPGTDLDFEGYSITNAGSISATGALTADSLLLTSFGQAAGGFSVGGTLSADSLVVTEVIWGEFSSIGNHTSDSLQEGESNLYFSTTRVLEALDDTLAYLTARIADLDSSAYIFGCTYADALNFDSTATRDDGSCEHILGCIYFAALNYDETATKDDGSCEFEGFGCNDPEALNYDETSDTNDGSCEYPYACGVDVLTYRGVDYTTVLLDGQCWFVQNLRATKFANGDPISDFSDTEDWKTAFEPGFAAPAGDEANVEDLGLLYNFFAVDDARGLCPTGWHVANNDDWLSLKDSIGGSNGQKLRSSPTDVPSWNGTNESGFSALPAGSRNELGAFENFEGESAPQNMWWAAYDTDAFWFARVFEINNNFLFQSAPAAAGVSVTRTGYSVRCVEGDPESVSQGTISTNAATDVAENGVTLSGTVDSQGEGYLSVVGFIWGTDPNLEGATVTAEAPSGTSISLALDAWYDGIEAETTYYFTAYGRSAGGIVTGDTLSFTTPEPSCTPVTFDGYSYPTVLIDDKCWFAENLKTTVFANGDSIEHMSANEVWTTTYLPGYVNPAGDDATVVDGLGRLYNYFAHEDTRGICPTGWHPSTGEDLHALSDFMGSENSPMLRSSASDEPSWDGSNISGFSAVPSGYRKFNGTYEAYDSNKRMETWGSIMGDGKLRNMGLIEGVDDIIIYSNEPTSPIRFRQGYSIRCVEGDPATGDVPSVSTVSASDTTATTISLSGSIVSAAGDGLATAVGFVWGTDPDLAGATMTIQGVTGDSISVALEDLTPSTTYYYAAFARNRFGYGYGETMSFETTAQLNACADVGGTVTYDGHDYEVVGIGSQCWFAENLQTNVFSDGTAINDGGADGFTESEWMNLSSPASSVYGGPLATYWHDAEYALANWGRIYNGYAINSTRGICPTGWHVPTEEDWGALGTELGGAPEPLTLDWLKYPGVGHILKEPGVYSSNTYGSFYQDLTHEGSNAVGWNGRPSGFRASQNGVFQSATYQGFYAVAGADMFFETVLNQVDAYLKDTSGDKMGCSVRCLKDSE